MDMEIEAVDRVSNLPEFILHDILSLLPRKDSARTSVLSKQWNLLWESFPVLDFEQHTYTQIPTFLFHIESRFAPRIHNFLNGVKNSLIKFCQNKLRGRMFRLEASNLDPKSALKVVQCLELALKFGFVEIEIIFQQPIESTSYGLILPETVLAPNPLRYYSLKKLSLNFICLSEKSIHDIVQNCPNICSLSLTFLSGLERLNISKLEKLEVVNLYHNSLISVDIDAPYLLEFDFWGQDNPCIFNMSSCQGLRKLILRDLNVKDQVFHSFISNFPLLEDLKVTWNATLRRVKLSGKNLKSVNFFYGKEIESIEIDAPALLSFRCEAEILPRVFLKSVPSQLQIVHQLGMCLPINTSRFVNLRDVLASSTRLEFLTVRLDMCKVVFYREELRQVVIPPAFQLEHLELEFPETDECLDAPTLIDGLVWSCYPKRISVSLGTIPQNSYIKIMFESLLDNEKHQHQLTCCDKSLVKCWRHYLKSARIESFGGQCLDGTVLLDKLMSDDLTSDQVICLKLEWFDTIY